MQGLQLVGESALCVRDTRRMLDTTDSMRERERERERERDFQLHSIERTMYVRFIYWNSEHVCIIDLFDYVLF